MKSLLVYLSSLKKGKGANGTEPAGPPVFSYLPGHPHRNQPYLDLAYFLRDERRIVTQRENNLSPSSMTGKKGL